MKKLLVLALMSAIIAMNPAAAQGERKSPAVKVSQKVQSGATVTIDYSQPSLNGRTIGSDVEPKLNKIWRMGANEATTFEVDRDVTLDGYKLPAGKYSVFGIAQENSFTLIFNKEWKIWGTQYASHRDKDVLHFDVKKQTADVPTDKLTYTIAEDGKVSMVWGDMAINFYVQ